MRIAVTLAPLVVVGLFACNGSGTDPDADEDGDGASAAIDCNDQDATIAPGLPERCDGKDNNCDNLVDNDAFDAAAWFRDVDEDGYGDPEVEVRACASPGEGYVDNGDDCADLFAESHPGADEICDGNDNDCDGDVDEDPVDPATWYRDADDDEYGDEDDSVEACAPPEGYIGRPGDCADDDETRNPGVAEACTGVDDDCDGDTDEDVADAPLAWPDEDEDGHGDTDGTPIRACTPPEGWAASSDDCDDAQPAVHGGALEICDGLDNDCSTDTSEAGLVSTEGANAASIADAIAAASTGGDVQICAGTWSENVTVPKTLTLNGPAGAASTILQPATTGTPIITVTGGALTLSGLTLTKGSATDGGAVEASRATAFTARDVIFDGNEATANGGAVRGPTGAALVTITACTFQDNVAGGHGGALVAGSLTVERSTFEANLAQDGGGLYLDGADVVLDVDTVLRDNEAERDGGGIYLASAHRIDGGALEGNAAGRDGGGIWAADGGTIIGITIDGSVAEEDGGAVFAAGDATLETLVLTDNAATRGGAIAVADGDVSITACDISDSLALDEGGAVAIIGGGKTTITGSSLLRNEATTGGGAWLGVGELTSSGTGWGAGSDDNDPDDVVIAGGSTYDGYGASASFTCTTASGVCK